MSLILYIQTALETAMMGIAEHGQVKASRECGTQKEHATFLQPAIGEICRETGIGLNQLAAVCVVSGPGSYTGLRVGMAGAKGLCFALQIPLIQVGTLRWMAAAGKHEDALYLCPMIDARRMEVFTGLFRTNGENVMEPKALILEESLFKSQLDEGRVAFFGGGAAKFKPLAQHPNAVFPPLEAGHKELAEISCNLYQSGIFSNLAHTAPLYGKEFHSPASAPEP